jgi:dUTP pyrophosphatase
VSAGVIDRDYRGNVGIVLFNFGSEEFVVKKGDKVAQLVLEKIFETEVKEVEDLDETERGADGFGSTGVSVDDKTESDAKRLKTKDSDESVAVVMVES